MRLEVCVKIGKNDKTSSGGELVTNDSRPGNCVVERNENERITVHKLFMRRGKCLLSFDLAKAIMRV